MKRKWVLILFIIFPGFVYGQTIDNPSFEGTPETGIPPPSWYICNTYSTPDTQPGTWGVTSAASDGNTFLSLTTRGALGYPNDNTLEAVAVKLNNLKSNTCYNLSLDLSWFNEFRWESIHYLPVILKVWLSSGQCLKTELVWTSPLINHTNWQTYNFNFNGSKESSHLLFEVNYNGSSSYYGSMLLDNIRIAENKVNIGADTIICSGKSIKLEVDNMWENVTWSNGSHEHFIEIKNGTYWTQVSTKKCLLRDTITIKYQQPISIALGEKINLCEGKDTVLRATTPNGKYLWSNGSTESQIIAKEAGDYWVEIDNSCEVVRDEITISRRENCCEISAPNVFTPNDDNINDYFEISTESNIVRYRIKIFNSWGKLVYESQTLDDYWDGILNNGNTGTSGVYFYSIQLTCIEKNRILDKYIKGPISLLR